MFLKPGLNILIDGQWGSTGKGKVAANLAKDTDIALAVSDFQANAGHTTMMDDGSKFVVHTLPTSVFINKDCIGAINAAATINLNRLMQEIDECGIDERRLKIHPNACIIQDKHVQEEMESMQWISSTCQGVGAALSEKIRRGKGVCLAMDEPRISRFVMDTVPLINAYLDGGATVLAETAQGFDLSINYGFYPYVTSRDITVASTLNNCGVHPMYLSEVIGVLRSYPIRVGHAYDKDDNKIGDSGTFYSDQKELSWEDITTMSGSEKSLSERTTVTNKVRRIFTFSNTQLSKFMLVNNPTQLAINFVDYLDYSVHGSNDLYKVTESAPIKAFLKKIASVAETYKSRVTYLGTGPKFSAYVESEV